MTRDLLCIVHRSSLIVFCAWLAFLQVVLASPPDTAKVVATVNGEAITTKMVQRELIRIHTAGATDTSRVNFSLDKLVQRMINDRLLEQEARSVGLDQDSAVIEKVNHYRDNAAYRAMMKAVFPDTFKASEDEVRAEFAKDFQRFDIRTLCVMDSALAASLADSIRHGAPMATLAKAHSIDKYKDNGGLAGSYILLDLPLPVQPQALSSKPGDLIGPNYLWRTFALIQIEQRLDPDTAMKLDSVRSSLEKVVIGNRRTAAVHAYAQKLRATNQVTVDSSALDSLPLRMAQNVADPKRVIIRVGATRSLTATDLRDQFMFRIAGNPTRDSRKVLREIVDEQIETLLFQTEAAQSNFRDVEDVREPAKAFEDSILVIAYLQDVVAANVSVSQDEIAAFYGQNKSLYHEPSRYKVATLTRNSEQEADSDYTKLQSGADFGWLARHHSTDDARDLGGERDWLTSDKLPADIGGALDSMKIGAVTKPVKTLEGLVIIKLVDRQAGAPMSLDRVKSNLEANVQRKKQLDAIDATVKQLRRSAEIHVHEDVIKELRITGKKS